MSRAFTRRHGRMSRKMVLFLRVRIRMLAKGVWPRIPEGILCTVAEELALSRATNITGLSHVGTVSDGAPGYWVIYNFIRCIPCGEVEKKVEIR